MQYRITARHGHVGPVRQSINAAWEAAAALLPNAALTGGGSRYRPA
jgi:hypothetical protein